MSNVEVLDTSEVTFRLHNGTLRRASNLHAPDGAAVSFSTETDFVRTGDDWLYGVQYRMRKIAGFDRRTSTVVALPAYDEYMARVRAGYRIGWFTNEPRTHLFVSAQPHTGPVKDEIMQR